MEVARHPSQPLIQIRATGGAASDVGPEVTAYAHRTTEILVTASLLPPQAPRELNTAVRPLWAHAIGAYRNFENDTSADTFDRAFPGATGVRVRELAQKYDPTGVLRRVHP